MLFVSRKRDANQRGNIKLSGKNSMIQEGDYTMNLKEINLSDPQLTSLIKGISCGTRRSPEVRLATQFLITLIVPRDREKEGRETLRTICATNRGLGWRNK